MIAFLHGSRRGSTDQRFANRRFVRYWLYIVFLMLIVIVLVGGITRIMGAGLSITEWQPIHGIIPPYGQNQWDEEFLKYQQITQYQHLNPNMTLAEFKHIFWWEWVHRLLARAVGFLIALPMTFFWLTGRLEKMVKWRLVSILLLCFLQGFIGWWMVTSGLGRSQLVRVSQYRLAIHLVMGCVIITAVLALARGLVEHTGQSVVRSIQRFAGLLVVLAFFQIYLGALVAGLHAGRVYTTWPMMDGHFIPDGLLHLQPLWRNLFENVLTVQFVHRFFAYLLLAFAIIHALNVAKHLPETKHARRALFLLILVFMQMITGIITVLLEVPLVWGLIHQVFALIILSYSVVHWTATKGALPLPS